MNKKNYWKILLGVIIFLTVIVRFYKLGQIPGSLNHDELALGYNAYSLMMTGADEHGAIMPLSLRSFGDWKLPLYPLITIPFIALLGLTEFAVRLPSAIAGLLGVFLVFQLSYLLIKNRAVSLFASFFYAISPWGIYFSRMAYEANLAITLFLAGCYLFLKFIDAKKKDTKLLLYASILFPLTIFTYHSFVVFTPLFLIGLLYLYRKKLPKTKWTIASLGVIVLFVSLSAYSTLSGSVQKVSAIGIFNDSNVLYNRVTKLRSDGAHDNDVVAKILHSRYSAVPYHILQNYMLSFSPDFLFDKGGEKLLHTLGEFGNLYLIDAVFLIAGIAGLFWYREKALPFIFLWLLTGPIPSAITKDAPSSTRLYILLPLLTIIAGYGAYQLVLFFKNDRVKQFLGVGFAILFLINVLYFFDIYFTHIDVQRGEYLHAGYKEMVELSRRYPDHKVVIYGYENFPYISFLFYEKYDPRRFQKEVEYYPYTGNFLFVKKFGRYEFVDNINYENLQPKTLYIDYRGIRDIDKTINLPNGKPAFKYFFKET